MNPIDLKKNPHELATFIHQAVLNPHLTEESLTEICSASNLFKISRLCTDLLRLSTIKQLLGNKSQTKIIATIAFPFGNIPTTLKKKEAEFAASQGADELDVVPNFRALNQGEITLFAEELAEIAELNLPTRVVLDINNLPREKLSIAIDASIDAGVYGIQSSNGFGPSISNERIKEIALLVKNRCDIKAVGGIKTLSHAIDLIEAGATQIGTSYGITLLQEIKEINTSCL